MIRALALVLSLWASAASADDRRWPALYDVSGVAANDVLNIRAEPDAGAPIIGILAPDAAGVEVILPGGDGGWGLVNTGEAAGWASLAYLSRQPGQGEGVPDTLFCGGTEPFWSLDITPDALLYNGLDLPGFTFSAGTRKPASGRADRWSIRSWADGTSATAVIVAAQCSDGMSDRSYGLSLDLILSTGNGHTHYAGCCSLAP